MIRDGGITGLVLKLGKSFQNIQIQGDKMKVAAGTKLTEISREACKAGISGFEFLESVDFF